VAWNLQDFALFIGLDVGKSEHHATALTTTGEKAYDKPLPNASPGSPLGVPRVDAGPLDTQEDKDGHEHRALDLLEERVAAGQVIPTGEVADEDPGVEEEHHEHQEQGQWHQLGHRDDRVDPGCFLYPAADQEVERPHRGHRNDEGRPGITRAQHRLQAVACNATRLPHPGTSTGAHPGAYTHQTNAAPPSMIEVDGTEFGSRLHE